MTAPDPVTESTPDLRPPLPDVRISLDHLRLAVLVDVDVDTWYVVECYPGASGYFGHVDTLEVADWTPMDLVTALAIVSDGTAEDQVRVLSGSVRGLMAERDRLRDEVTEAHTRNANLRSEHRAEVGWLSEACRLTVADAAIVRDQRGRLHRDATTAREKLIELIGGDWTVEPSLTELATYAARFWGDDRKEIADLRAEVSRLVAESTPAIPDGAEEQIARRIADYWHDLRAAGDEFPTAGPSESDYGVAHHVLALVRGWGSAVTPEAPADTGAVSGVVVIPEDAEQQLVTAFFGWGPHPRGKARKALGVVRSWAVPPAGPAVPAPADTEEG